MSDNSLKLNIPNIFSGWFISMNSLWNAFLLLFFIFVIADNVKAQSSDNYNINSPYSRIGIGNLAPEGSIRNIGMGGTGVSHSHGNFLNLINPALLINNNIYKYDSLTTILEGAMTAQIRRISDNNASQHRGTANFFSFYYAFPVHKRWVTAVGLRPYTNVSYSIIVNSPVSGPISGSSETAEVTYQGKGGINRAELANAYRLTKSIHLGFSASYLFGAVNNYSFSKLNNQPDSNIVGSNQSLYYKGFLFRPGISFRTKLINRGEDSSVFINLGFTYDGIVNEKVNEDFYIERRNVVNQIISKINTDAITRSITLPSSFRVGLSFDKATRWNIAMDFTYYQASKYKGINSRDNLKNGFTLALGGELAIGDYQGFESVIKTKYVRAGLSYTKSPIEVNGKQLTESAVYLGYSFPVGKHSHFRNYAVPRPQLNFAIMAGQIGTTDNNLVKEQYIKGFVGFTINDRWFRKRRID